MEITGEFLSILESEKVEEIIPFLKGLSDQQKKEVSSILKKKKRYYSEFVQIGNSWSTRSTTDKSYILSLTSFVCQNRRDFTQNQFNEILKSDILVQIVPWYVPSWFSTYINELVDTEWLPISIDYAWLMKFKDLGVLDPSPALIARLLTGILVNRETSRKLTFRPEALADRPETLNEHIWYLFEYETDLHWTDQYARFEEGNQPQKSTWLDTLKLYTDRGEIKRERILEESLYAANRNFNKSLSGWFIGLFVFLDPSDQEILEMQDVLFSIFTSPHSKPINEVLRYLKKVARKSEFNDSEFIAQSNVLLTSDVKSVVKSTLMILDKISRKKAVDKMILAEALVNTLVNTDKELQERAAKIIVFLSQGNEGEIQTLLAPYSDIIFSSTRKLFGPLLVESTDEKQENLEPNLHLANEDPEPLTNCRSIDDLIYFCSQAFENNHPSHLDLLPSLLLKFQSDVSGEVVDKLEPALKNAYTSLNQVYAAAGHFESLLATFFIDYTRILIVQNPFSSSRLKKLNEKNLESYNDTINGWIAHREAYSLTAKWKMHYDDPIYFPHKELLLAVLMRQLDQRPMELLSTPTHDPCWLDISTLIDRLISYKNSNFDILSLDLQLAIARAKVFNLDQAVSKINDGLNGELQQLMLFIIDKYDEPMPPFNYGKAWLMAGLIKNPKKYSEFPEFKDLNVSNTPTKRLTGQLEWKPFVEEYYESRWDYKSQKTIQSDKLSYNKRLKFYDRKQNIKNDKGREATKSKAKNPLDYVRRLIKEYQSEKNAEKPKKIQKKGLLLDYLHWESSWMILQQRDAPRFLSMIPNHYETVLASIAERFLTQVDYIDAAEKELMVNIFSFLPKIWFKPGRMAHRFAALGMLSCDKTVRSHAGELWVLKVQEDNINSALLGEALGDLESIEFGPLKRLTDLIQTELFRISQKHDKELFKMTQKILERLPDKPIRNLKKLIEIYQELQVPADLAFSDSDLLQAKFNIWRETNSLKRLLK